MAPDTVERLFNGLPKKATVLDPMCGSGVVLRCAGELGFKSIGFDIDPLAVLMSRVWTTKSSVRPALVEARALIERARMQRLRNCKLPWIDDCPETKRFTRFWFANEQRRKLRQLSYLLIRKSDDLPLHIRNCLWLALSRIIITKHAGASLAWDVSHSRPHKMREENDFDVEAMFLRSATHLVDILEEQGVKYAARVRIGDCRRLSNIRCHSIDAIITSPPYLNAIDYLRGHKLSLVWMGHSIPTLRKLRATSIGTEAARLHSGADANCDKALNDLREFSRLPQRQRNIVRKYTADASSFLLEMHRLVKPGGSLALVLGDSNIRGHRIENSKIFSHLARQIGFKKVSQHRRHLKESHRYLPVTSKDDSLENRMRYEVIQTYVATSA
jgi:SAM-dependent methyltransferase